MKDSQNKKSVGQGHFPEEGENDGELELMGEMLFGTIGNASQAEKSEKTRVLEEKTVSEKEQYVNLGQRLASEESRTWEPVKPPFTEKSERDANPGNVKIENMDAETENLEDFPELATMNRFPRGTSGAMNEPAKKRSPESVPECVSAEETVTEERIVSQTVVTTRESSAHELRSEKTDDRNGVSDRISSETRPAGSGSAERPFREAVSARMMDTRPYSGGPSLENYADRYDYSDNAEASFFASVLDKAKRMAEMPFWKQNASRMAVLGVSVFFVLGVILLFQMWGHKKGDVAGNQTVEKPDSSRQAENPGVSEKRIPAPEIVRDETFSPDIYGRYPENNMSYGEPEELIPLFDSSLAGISDARTYDRVGYDYGNDFSGNTQVEYPVFNQQVTEFSQGENQFASYQEGPKRVSDYHSLAYSSMDEIPQYDATRGIVPPAPRESQISTANTPPMTFPNNPAYGVNAADMERTGVPSPRKLPRPPNAGVIQTGMTPDQNTSMTPPPAYTPLPAPDSPGMTQAPVTPTYGGYTPSDKMNNGYYPNGASFSRQEEVYPEYDANRGRGGEIPVTADYGSLWR